MFNYKIERCSNPCFGAGRGRLSLAGQVAASEAGGLSVREVDVLAIDDPTLEWGAGLADLGAYVAALRRLGPAGVLRNARFDLHALRLADRAFVVVVPQGRQGSWVTSLATTYGRAARDEVRRKLSGRSAAAFWVGAWLAETVLRLTRADQAVYVNHLLFSTSLYGAWSGDGLDDALRALRRRFPGRAIVWRSLNAHDNRRLLSALDARGGRRLVSRLVWSLADPARQWRPRTDVKADLKLAPAQGFRVERPPRLEPQDLDRVVQLYEAVYLRKYSPTNPAYTPEALSGALASGVLSFEVVRSPAGEIQAFAADHVYDGVLCSPMLGHDPDRPRRSGLYRIAMSLSVLRALELGLPVNYSAGAGAFKRNRGATPTLEFMIVFDSHLPPWRRAGYALVSRALQAITPQVERVALR